MENVVVEQTEYSNNKGNYGGYKKRNYNNNYKVAYNLIFYLK